MIAGSSPVSFPPAFVERLKSIAPRDRGAAILDALAHMRATSFRINTLIAEADATLKSFWRQGFELSNFEWIEGAYWVPTTQRRALTESEAYRQGAIYIQNPASMVPALFLAPQPSDRVLDLAAAPGSKTLQLAAMMGNQGWISAVEVVKERFFRLRANLKKHGAENVHTYHKDGAKVWRQVPEQFDKVLLDAPCSSEGQFNLTEPGTFQYWSEKKIKDMARKQKRLLFSAIQCLKPGGTLVYSTCTFAPEENEAVVDAMLKKFGQALEVVPVSLNVSNAAPGITQWRGKDYHPDLEAALRLLPDRLMEGFFVCKLRKRGSTLSS